MRKMTIGLLAAAGIALAIPANAEDVYVGVGAGPVGVGVDVGHRDNWRHRSTTGEVIVHERHHRHCEVTVIHRHGETKRIKRCY